MRTVIWIRQSCQSLEKQSDFIFTQSVVRFDGSFARNKMQDLSILNCITSPVSLFEAVEGGTKCGGRVKGDVFKAASRRDGTHDDGLSAERFILKSERTKMLFLIGQKCQFLIRDMNAHGHQ